MTGNDELTTPGNVIVDPEAPTQEQDLDLVALLDAELRRERIPLPGSADGALYIELQAWTGAQKMRYLNTGMEYAVPVGKAAATKATFHMDTIEQARALLESSIVDFRLRLRGKEVRYTGAQSVWSLLSQVPSEVLDWVVAQVRRFQGLEVVTPEGEA